MGKIENLDFKKNTLRKIKNYLQNISYKNNKREFTVKNPSGHHAICAGLTENISVKINGHVGYYCGGMNQKAHITINGNAGTGLGENMMSGLIHVKGNASQSAGATAHGGTIIIDGDASSRCGISMKGISIVVHGNIGHMSGFMAQSGTLVVCGDAGDALGDSIYEAQLFVRGSVESLGADCVAKEMRLEHLDHLRALLSAAGCNHKAEDFTRYGSARNLYHFDVDNSGVY